jgi:nondiscriminating glutamyl-tRNA synthetase
VANPDLRVRIAPSPTGPLHLGTARTALFNFLVARHLGGTFIFRLEDTDRARSTEAYELDILEGLHWLGIRWDEGPGIGDEGCADRALEHGTYGPYRQSQRTALYAEAAARLLAEDKAYYCYCTADELEAERKRQEAAHEPSRYNGRCAHLAAAERAAFEAEGRRPVIRFRIPETRVVSFDDIVRGHVEIETNALGGDLVIVRSDGTPLYHFTVVVDDAAMAISHVIRGEDHLSNTPKHILLFEALGADVPRFAHLPLILNPDRTKMSKRKTQTAVADYRAQGFIPEAFVNYLSQLGWSGAHDDDILSLDELVEGFDLSAVNRAGAIFDRNRLEWLNGQWIRRLPAADLVDRLRPFLQKLLDEGRIDWLPSDQEVSALLPILQERLPTLAAVDLVDFLFVHEITFDPATLVPKRWEAATTAEALGLARVAIADVGRVSWEADEIEPPLRRLAEERGWKAGDLFMPIRVAITGKTATPPLFDTMVALGYEPTLHRIDRALDMLNALTIPRQNAGA